MPASAWTGLALLAASLLLLLGDHLARWIAVGLLLAVAPRLAEPLLRLPWIADHRERIARSVPILAVTSLALVLLGELLLGQPPASRDHGIHYFQTRVLIDELLPRGELVGWSESLNSGYPFGDSYPVVGYLFTGAANLLTFGAIPLRVSYAWGLLAVWLIALGGVAWLGSTIAAELEQRTRERNEGGAASEGSSPAPFELLDPRWAGALAAVAWLIDPGAAREGGWNYLMFHGVWPQLLSSGLWIASLPATWRALQRPSPRRLAFAALLLGLSVLAHPFGMLTAATSAAAWPVVLWATGSFSRLPPAAIRWWLVVHVLAGLVCAGGVLTFLASADSMARYPVPWRSLGALVSELVMGELFQNHRAWLGPLALVGLVAAIRRGRGMAWLGVGLVVALLVLGSEASITVLRLDLLVSGFKNLQFPRYAIALKPVLFAFAGVGAALLLRRLWTLPDRDSPFAPEQVRQRPRPIAARLLACLLLAPIVVTLLDDRGRLLPSPVDVAVLEGTIHEAPEQELLAALQAEAASLPSERPLTVAFLRRGMGGGTYPIFAITDAGARMVLDGHIPTVNYKHQVRRRSPEALRLMGVTHVLHDKPLLSSDDRRLAAELEPVGEFGVWTLARLRAVEPAAEHPRQDIRIVAERAGAGRKGIDPAHVSVTRESATELSVTLAQGGSGIVQLPLGPYRKWWVERDGVPIGVEAVSVARGVPGLALPFEEPGTITLRYQTPKAERIAGWISVVGIALVLLGLGFSRELSLVERLHSERAQRISWALGLLALAGVLLLAATKQQRQLGKTWTHLLGDHARSSELAEGRRLRFARDLVIDRAYSVARSNPDGCDGLLGRDARAGCMQEDARARVSMAYRAPYLYRCVHVVVPARGSLDLSLELEADEDLAGFFVRDGRDFRGLELRLPGQPEFQPPRSQNQRQHFHVFAETLQTSDPVIELRNSTDHDQGYCFALAAAQKPQ